jgi:hypothetical protein
MVSNDDLQRFYSDKGVSGSCPSCGQSQWEIGTAPDDKTDWALSSVRTDGSAFLPAPSVPAVILVCANCFTLRLHAYLGIKKWLDEHPISGAKA